MNSEQAKHWVTNIYHDIWQGNNLDKFADYYHPQVIAHLDGQMIDYTQIKAHAFWQKEHISELVFDFKDFIATENKIAFRLQSSGSKNNQQHDWQIIAIYHLKADKIYRCWALSNPRIDITKQI